MLVANPMIRVPANATRPPMTSIRGKPSPSRKPASMPMRIGELDEHRGGAGVDSLFAGIEGDAVDREPGDSDQAVSAHSLEVIRTSLRPIIMALRARLATSSRPRLRAPGLMS